jgi:hypothetical protein
MRVPGSNILSLAMTVVGTEKPVLNSVKLPLPAPDASGLVTPLYHHGIKIKAAVEPVPREVYEKLGLDLQKNYVYCYTSAKLQDLQRNTACDMIDYGGRRYNVQSNEPWNGQDGWQAGLCVDIGPTP